MCLTVNLTLTNRLKANFPGKFWKVLGYSNGGLYSPYYGMQEWLPGEFGCGPIEYGPLRDGMIITIGIHAFVDKDCAEEEANNLGGDSHDHIVVEVTALLEDLIACGDNGDVAFTKVFLSEAEYARAMQLGKEQEWASLMAGD